MPRQPYEQYYSEKELHEMVNRINALASEDSPWKFTQARKEHQDLFGEVIKPGEHYFKYERGPAFDGVIKLSALSMEKLCFALFESTVLLEAMADRILEQRHKRMFEVMRKVSILGNRSDQKSGPSRDK